MLNLEFILRYFVNRAPGFYRPSVQYVCSSKAVYFRAMVTVLEVEPTG